MCFISEIRKANLIGHGAVPGACADKGPARRRGGERGRKPAYSRNERGGGEWGGVAYNNKLQ